MSEYRVIHGCCEDVLSTFAPGSVSSIVTSPPYADQRDYEKAAAGVEGRNGTYPKHTHPRTRNASRAGRDEAPWVFVEEFEPVLRELLRVCSPTGSLALNLGIIMRNGEEHGYADEILRRARAMGWKLLHRMVWHKLNAIPLSHPSYLHIKHEWVFWLAPQTDAYRGYDKDTRVPHSETSLRRVHKRGSENPLHPDGAKPATVINVAVGGESVNHPAIMALDLALHLVSLTCPPGGTVLDPYCGSATTGVAAIRRGRNFIGIEKEAEFCELSNRRLETVTPPLFAEGAEAA